MGTRGRGSTFTVFLWTSFMDDPEALKAYEEVPSIIHIYIYRSTEQEYHHRQ